MADNISHQLEKILWLRRQTLALEVGGDKKRGEKILDFREMNRETHAPDERGNIMCSQFPKNIIMGLIMCSS